MRYAPIAAALSLLIAVNASVGQGAEPEADPRAAVLIAEGRAALEAGEPQEAVDAFEAAFAVDPASTPILLELAYAARRQELQGKAIRYYREVQARDPRNYAAIAGEGEALIEKGAIEKARSNLARLESHCGANCPETLALAARLEAGAQPRMVTAESLLPDPIIIQN